MIPFNNLNPLYDLLRDEIDTAVQRVLRSGWYILGPEVEAFEAEFAAYHGGGYVVSVANGTDAIELALKAYDIGQGDEVMTVSHTAQPTVNAIEQTGATPVLVEVDERTYTIDPAAVEAALTPRTKAIIPVHLYGQTADMTALKQLAEKHALLLIEDCAQAHGAKHHGKLAGTMGHAAAYSFYPTKNLGALGDGGAIFTPDANIAARLKRLRNYGQSRTYHYVEKGVNSRLDEMQAAILRVKLAHLDDHNAQRRGIAQIYTAALHGVTLPYTAPENEHVYHLYVIRHPQRDTLMQRLQEQGIGTKIHYPVPVHLQQPHIATFGAVQLPHTQRIAAEIVSLPLYIGMTPETAETVAAALNHIVATLA
jgi:dTDP-4-amino-4,6-dideoxygalactose transaminase